MKKPIEKLTFVDFVKKILNVIKLEIIVTWLAITEDQLIVFVISMLLKIKVISYLSHFTILVTMIVIYFLKSYLIERKIKWNLKLYLKEMKNVFQLKMDVLDW